MMRKSIGLTALYLTVCLVELSISGKIPSAGPGLRCWTCNNADSNEQCLRNGTLETCQDKNMICADSIHHVNPMGRVVIDKGCQQDQACYNNYIQNVRAGAPAQCSVNSPTSVCRCCCGSDSCNADLMTCFDSMENENGIGPRLPRLYRKEKKSSVVAKCETYPSPPAGSEMQCQGNLNVGSTCIFICHKGLMLKGNRQISCTSKLTWSSALPKCVPRGCPRIQVPALARMYCLDGGNRCRFRCHMGFVLEGNKVITCSKVVDGFGWSSPAPNCRARNVYPRPGAGFIPKRVWCRRPWRVQFGKVSCTAGGRPGSVCSYSCDRGYVTFGKDSQITCGADGQWSAPLPHCQQVKCDALTHPANGAVSCSNGAFHGSECSFYCDAGYKLSGASTTQCVDDDEPGDLSGMWANATPVCLPEA